MNPSSCGGGKLSGGLLDELDDLASASGAGSILPMAPGNYLITRLPPAEEVWLLSGIRRTVGRTRTDSASGPNRNKDRKLT